MCKIFFLHNLFVNVNCQSCFKKIPIKLKTVPEVTGTDRILRSKAMKSANNFELTQDQEETNGNFM